MEAGLLFQKFCEEKNALPYPWDTLSQRLTPQFFQYTGGGIRKWPLQTRKESEIRITRGLKRTQKREGSLNSMKTEGALAKLTYMLSAGFSPPGLKSEDVFQSWSPCHPGSKIFDI